jgi:hypothetical protein
MTFADRVRRAMIRTSPYPPLRWIYAAGYGAILLRLMMRVRKIPEIRRLQWRAPNKGHRFGVSDLDVRAETTRLNTAQFFALCDRLADVIRPSSTATRILDFYLFGPDEAQLQRRLGPVSFGESRLIRLLGPKAAPADWQLPAHPPENAPLCRAMYEYGSFLQEVFGETPSLHSTWKMFRRFKRIDDAFAARGGALDFESAQLRDTMKARAERIAAGGVIRELQAADKENLYAAMLAEVDSIAQPFSCPGDAARDSIFRPVSECVAPETLPSAIASCAAQVDELCAELSGIVQSAILGCVPAGNFDYRLYLILRDGISTRERIEVFRAIRARYAATAKRQIPATYLRLRFPIVLTSAMWRARARWFHAVRPVEECFFIERHGVVLSGNDIRGDLAEPAAVDIICSAAIATADLRNLIWGAVHDRRPRRLIDALLGRIPALWLLLDRSIIVTSSAEAVAQCAASGFPKVSLIEELREKLGAMIPEKLPATDEPMWKPALEACSMWIDEISQMAIARLDGFSADAPPHRRQ